MIALQAYDQLRDNLVRARLAWNLVHVRAVASQDRLTATVPVLLEQAILATNQPYQPPSTAEIRALKQHPPTATAIEQWLDGAAQITLDERRRHLQSLQPQLVDFVHSEPADDLDRLQHNLTHWQSELLQIESPRLATAKLLPTCWTLRFWSQAALWDDPSFLDQIRTRSDTWNECFRQAADASPVRDAATRPSLPSADPDQVTWPWVIHRRMAVWRGSRRIADEDEEVALCGAILPYCPSPAIRHHVPVSFLSSQDRKQEYQRQWNACPLPSARTHPQLTTHSDPWTPQSFLWPLSASDDARTWFQNLRPYLQCSLLPGTLSAEVAAVLRFQWRALTDSAGRPWIHAVIDYLRQHLSSLDTQGDPRGIALLEYMRWQLYTTSHYQSADVDDEPPYWPYHARLADAGFHLQFVAETGRGDPQWVPCPDVDILDRQALHTWMMNTITMRSASTTHRPDSLSALRARQSNPVDLDGWVRHQSFQLPAMKRQPQEMQGRSIVLMSPPIEDVTSWANAREHHLADEDQLRTTRWLEQSSSILEVIQETLDLAAEQFLTTPITQRPSMPATSRARAWLLRQDPDTTSTDDRWMGPVHGLGTVRLARGGEEECIAWTVLHRHPTTDRSTPPAASVPSTSSSSAAAAFVYVDLGVYQPRRLLDRPVLLDMVVAARQVNVPSSSADWRTMNHLWFFQWNLPNPPTPSLRGVVDEGTQQETHRWTETSMRVYHDRWMRVLERFVAAVMAPERNIVELELVRMASWVPPEYFYTFQQQHRWTEWQWRRWVSDWTKVRPYLLSDLTGYVRLLSPADGPYDGHEDVYQEWKECEERLVEARLGDVRWHTCMMDFFQTLYPMSANEQTCWHEWVQSRVSGKALDRRAWWTHARSAPVSRMQPVLIPTVWMELCVYVLRMRRAWDVLCESLSMTATDVVRVVPHTQAMAAIEAFVSSADPSIPIPAQIREQVALATLWSFDPSVPHWQTMRAAQILTDAYNRLQSAERQWLRQCRWSEEDQLGSWIAALHVIAFAGPATKKSPEEKIVAGHTTPEELFARQWPFAVGDVGGELPRQAYHGFQSAWKIV